MKLKEILFLPAQIRCQIENAASVLDVALKNKVPIEHSCGGMGSCTTCRVWIESPLEGLSQRTDIEKEILENRGFAPNERLACQLKPSPGLVVRVPKPTHLDEVT